MAYGLSNGQWGHVTDDIMLP